MTDAQTWTAMALLSSLLFAVMTLLTRTVRAEMATGFERLGREMDRRFGEVDGRFAQIDGRFAQIDGRFAEVNGRLDVLDDKVERLDRDVWYVMDRQFGSNQAT